MGKRKAKKVQAAAEAPNQTEEESFAISLESFKKINYAYVMLAVILVFGFSLRMYHIDYPVIGYHNWKVAHYITEARNFANEGFFKYGFFVPMRDTTESIYEQPDGAHGDTFPLAPIVVGVLFKLFGESLVVARLSQIIFSVASVAVFYLLVKELFDRNDLALVSAFLAALNPLYVFFSHNVDVINPGLFFMLLGAYMYVLWHKRQLPENNFSYLYLAAFSIVLGTATKYTFGVIAFPILLVLPYKMMWNKRKDFIRPLLITGAILFLFVGWYFYADYLNRVVIDPETVVFEGPLDLIDVSVLWNREFWQVMRFYIADNFTLTGIGFAALGALFLLLFFTKNINRLGYRFMTGYLIGTFLFLIIMGFKLSGHSYHQFPVAPLIIFLIALALVTISANIGGFFGQYKNSVKILVLFILIMFLPLPAASIYNQSQESRNRQYNTQFPGLDVAGEYMRSHASKDDRMFHSSGQSFGVLWHAGIKGYKPPRDVAYFKEAEDVYNVSWIFAYQWGIPSYLQNPEIYSYLSENYRLVQIGFIENQQGAQPIWFLFRKGGTFDLEQINELVQNRPVFSRTYEYTMNSYEIRFINIE
jgi:uncharacterized membrane protein